MLSSLVSTGFDLPRPTLVLSTLTASERPRDLHRYQGRTLVTVQLNVSRLLSLTPPGVSHRMCVPLVLKVGR